MVVTLSSRVSSLSARFVFLLVCIFSENLVPADGEHDTAASVGRLWMPCDVVHDSVVKVAIDALRDEEDSAFYERTLSPCCSSLAEHGHAGFLTATMVGYKGGSLHTQINQDRAFVFQKGHYILSGVLDGHGELGHFVAEWGRHHLIEKLTVGLDRIVNDSLHKSSSPSTSYNLTNRVTSLLQDSFVEIDATLPDVAAKQGGATVSIVVQVGGHIFLANAGDSQSWLSAALLDPQGEGHTKEQLLEVQVIQQTRLDKPDDPEEKVRLTKAGMHVTPESEEDVARVYYQEASTGQFRALAMTRALGDREAYAVVAEPLVTVLSLADLKEGILSAWQTSCSDEESNSMTAQETCSTAGKSDATLEIRFFAMSATDGLIDYLQLHDMADRMAQALFVQDQHPLGVAQDFIQQSAALWRSEMQGQYRDDMALAVAAIPQK